MDSTPWFASKTIWFNLIVLVTSILQTFGVIPTVTSDDAGALALGVATIGNIALRFATKTAVSAGTNPITPPDGNEGK